MPARAWYSQSNKKSGPSCLARCGKAAIALGRTLAVGIVFVSVCFDIDLRYENSITIAIPAGFDVANAEMQFIQLIDTEMDLIQPIDTALRLISSRDTELQRIQRNAEATRASVVGSASMYNPYRAGYDSGGTQTASGEAYDRTAWTAAIQIDLRERFAGVRYGQNYQPVYALVESGDKKMIVKINDVGPLKPGRVIDLNEQCMRYFDPSLQAGLIHDVKITPLVGEDWTPGPIGGDQTISLAFAQ